MLALLANPVFRRWAVVFVLSISCGLFGYVKGLQHAEVKDLKETIVLAAKTATMNKALQAVSDSSGKDITEQQAKVQIIYKTITQKEIEYVKTDPHASDVLEPSFVRLYNAESLACDPATTSCQSAADVPGDVTHSEVIDNHKEVSDLYQQCRIANDGWIKFYSEVKAEYEKDNQ